MSYIYPRPISVIVPKEHNETIHFPTRFNVNIHSIIITNFSTSKNAGYQLGGETSIKLLLGPGEYRTLSNVEIDLIRVEAAVDGPVQIQAVGDPIVV